MAMIDVSEARKVREHGWTKRILLLEGFFDETDIPLLEKYDVETIVHDRRLLGMLQKNAPYKSLKVHIKVNSGMNRLGFHPEEEETIRQELQAIEGVQVMGAVPGAASH